MFSKAIAGGWHLAAASWLDTYDGNHVDDAICHLSKTLENFRAKRVKLDDCEVSCDHDETRELPKPNYNDARKR